MELILDQIAQADILGPRTKVFVYLTIKVV